MIPYAPEPLDRLRARFPTALAETFDLDAIILGSVLRAGERRSHVFDFEDGLRLIVSREDNGADLRGIHFSASITPGTALHSDLSALAKSAGRHAACRGLRERGEAAYRDLGGTGDATFIGFSLAKGVPHWFIHQPDTAPPPGAGRPS